MKQPTKIRGRKGVKRTGLRVLKPSVQYN